MRPVLLTFFIILLLCSCNQQPSSQNERPSIKLKAKTEAIANVVNDSTIYSFLNDMITEGGPEDILTCDKIADRELIEANQTVIDSPDFDTAAFSKDDINFIHKQLKAVSDFRLNPRLISNRTIISTDTLKIFFKQEQGSRAFWSSYSKKYGSEGFCTISMPLFSLSKETVIFDVSYFCGGMCGYGYTYIYKKKKGKWKLVKQLSSWIS